MINILTQNTIMVKVNFVRLIKLRDHMYEKINSNVFYLVTLIKNTMFIVHVKLTYHKHSFKKH